MATTSELTDTSLNIAGTTTINGIESTLSNNSSKVATSSAILTAINNSASNVSSYVDSQISSIMPNITITASTFEDFAKAVINNYIELGGRRKISIIAEWANNDYYTFEMTIINSGNCYGTITNLLHDDFNKNWNFKLTGGTYTFTNLCNEYWTFVDSIQPIYGGYKDLTVTTNLPVGKYLILTSAEINHGYDTASDIILIFLYQVNGGRLILAPQARGTTSSGGGTCAWAFIEITSTTNSLVYKTYGYINASYTQTFNVGAIRLFQ